MAIDYNDPRFAAVEAGKANELNNVNNTYNSMINQSDQYYQDQINAAKDYTSTQQKIQQDNTNFITEKIGQQKEQAEKDYTKEQSGSYVDFQKQTNQYSANAEQMASQGLNTSGYSESSKVSMYNQYQNRVATARDVFSRAVLNYDNSIKEAQLANNAKLAEIAYNALQTQLQLSLQGFQYKNTLLQTQLQQQQQVNNTYYSRWQDVQSQINTENQLAESVRQYNQNYALEQANIAATNSATRATEQANANATINKQGSTQSAQIKTSWYSGAINPDVKYGTFSVTDKSGVKYQPNNIGGVKLSKTGVTLDYNTKDQNIWTAKINGATRYYYWAGEKNKYIEIPAKTFNSMKKSGGGSR